MLQLPTRRRLESRRDALYLHLRSILGQSSVCQVEDIMRHIHILNAKLRTYFHHDDEPKEIFPDD